MPVIWIFREGKEHMLFYTSNLYKALLELRGKRSRAHLKAAGEPAEHTGAAHAVSLYIWGAQCTVVQHAQILPVSSTPPDPPSVLPHKTPKPSLCLPLFCFPQLPHKSEYPQISPYTPPLLPGLAHHLISSPGEAAAGGGWPAQWQVAPGDAMGEYEWKTQGFWQSIAPRALNTRALLL